MAEISKIQINGETYSVKDAQAREDYESLFIEEIILDCGGVPQS